MVKFFRMNKNLVQSRQAGFKYYDLIIAAFVSALLISNIAAVKLITIDGIITDGGAVLFPLVYIFGDILTEVYGYAYARRAIWAGFGVMIVAVLAFTVVGQLPASPEWGMQQSYSDILGFFPRIVLASLVAYLFGEFVNATILARLKIKFGGKRLWIRLIGSTIAGQLIDTVIFGLIAFGGMLSTGSMLNFIAVGWSFKTVVEVIMLPVTYRVIKFLKTKEHQDYYDKETDFSPFKLSTDK